MPKWVNVPNFFTSLRILMTPFIIQAIVSGRHTLALALFAWFWSSTINREMPGKHTQAHHDVL